MQGRKQDLIKGVNFANFCLGRRGGGQFEMEISTFGWIVWKHILTFINTFDPEAAVDAL